MEFTNAEIYNAKEPLQALVKGRFPVLVAYGLTKIVAALEPHIQAIDAVREQLVMTYGTPVDSASPGKKKIEPGDKHFGEFAVEYGRLMVQTVDVDCDIVEIPLKVGATCGACREHMERDLEIEPYALAALDKFIVLAGPVTSLQELARR